MSPPGGCRLLAPALAHTSCALCKHTRTHPTSKFTSTHMHGADTRLHADHLGWVEPPYASYFHTL